MDKSKLKELDEKLKTMLAQGLEGVEAKDESKPVEPSFPTTPRKVAVIRRRRGQRDRRIFLDEEGSPALATV